MNLQIDELQQSSNSQLHGPPLGATESARVADKTINRFWLVVCCAAVAFVIASGVHWALSHPYGTGYDETKYVIQVNYDRQRLANEGTLSYVGGFFTDDAMRPPMFRVLAAPVTWFAESTPSTLRITAIAYFLLTLGFVFATGHRLGGIACGAVMTTLVAICPIVSGPTFRFGTEYPLMLGLAMCVYFLARVWNTTHASTFSWIGLGIGLAIGMLAKPSFVTIMGPIGVMVLFVRWRGWIQGPSMGWLLRAAALGALLCAPWYGRNWLKTAHMIRRAQQFVRGEIATMDEYLYVMLNEVYALPLFGILLLAAGGAVVATVKLVRQGAFRPVLLLLVVLLLSVVPLHFAHAFLSNNQNPRFLAPSTFLVVIVAAVLMAQLQWTRLRIPMAVLIALIAVQVVTLAAPSFPMRRPMTAKQPIYDRPMYFNSTFPQWDWSVLDDYCREQGIEVERVGLLGLGLPMSRPQVQYPWVRRGERVQVDPLWRFTDGPFKMQAVLNAAEDMDLVITVPGYQGAHHDKNPKDNVHNAALVERLRGDPFYKEIRDLPIDPTGRQTVHVFINRSRS